MGDEADYLESQSDGGASDYMREIEREEYFSAASIRRGRYEDNKRSDVGTTIRCAGCGKRIVKSSYQTQFCSNKGRGNCKDAYWNKASETRRKRAFRYRH